MDEDRVKGTTTDIGGKVRDAAGGLLGDGKTQAKGKTDQASGQLQNAYGSAKDAVREVSGIVAGRLCGTSDNNTAHWHGFVSWCAATLVIFYLLTSALGGIIGGTFYALGSMVGAAGKGAASAVSGIAQGTNGGPLQRQIQRLVNPNGAQSAQDNIMAYMRASISGDQAGAAAARDRAVDSLAKTANISPGEARTRLQQAEQQARQGADQLKRNAQEAAEATRKGVASAGVFGFIALTLGAVASWFGGGVGAPRRETTVVRTSRSI